MIISTSESDCLEASGFRFPDASEILSLIEYDTNNGAAQSSDFLTFERQEMNSQYMGPEYSVDC